MKKSIFINAAIIALAMLASCQKEQFTENVTSGVTEFTATIEQPTKTAISDEGKVTWVAGDTITVTDAAQKSAVYVASSDGASTTFTLKDGQTAVGTGPYIATYGDIANQVYDAAGANCPLTAAETSTTTFKFSSPYAVVKITAESDGKEVIKSVDVNYGENVYALNCGDGVTLTSDGIDFFVSVRPATEAAALSVTFHTTDDKTATKTRTEAVRLDAKDLLPVTLTFAQDDWESPAPDIPGALKGVFSVSADKQVQFSRGNLWYGPVTAGATATFNFEDNQYDYKLGAYHEEASLEDSYWKWDSDHISHFFWSRTAEEAVKEAYNEEQACSESDVFFTNATGFTVNVGGKTQTGWHTLSTAEWQYLFAYNPELNEGEGGFDEDSPRHNLFNFDVTVCGKTNCLVLLPDDWDGSVISLELFKTTVEYDGTTVPSWQQMEDAGAVCLPATGCRKDSNIQYAGTAFSYWSASPDGESRAISILINDGLDLDSDRNRNFGFSVRLVTDVSAEPTEPEYVEMKMGTGDDAYTLKWATKNLGATKVATDYRCYGDYYQWGSVEKLYTSIAWTDNNDGSFVGLKTKGFDKTNLTYTEEANLSNETNDVVRKTYPGTGWRMPTSQEFQDLYDACVNGTFDKETYQIDACGETTEITQKGVYWCVKYDGVAGVLFYDGTNRLFFPAAGDGYPVNLLNEGYNGFYWSSTFYQSDMAYSLTFGWSEVNPKGFISRDYGCSVRPVSD